MEHFFYLCDLSFYSSSMISDSLIASDKTGAVHVITPGMNVIKTDHFKKDIKFYPIDDLCFTTTDMCKGIRVWDRGKGEIVYSYKEDSIRMHTYSKEGCLAAVGDGCVKLYDLRMRYNVGAIPLSMCWMAEWGADRIYCVNNECVVEYDIRNISGVVGSTRIKDDHSKEDVQESKKMIEGVLDFISIDSGEFCTVKRKDVTYLLRLSNSTPAEAEASRRVSIGSRMMKVKSMDDFVIGILDGNKVGFYEYRDTWSYTFDNFKRIEWMWFGRNNSYAFADKKIYFMEGGYEKFKELARQ